MSTRAVLSGILASAGILIVGWEIGVAATAPTSTTTTTGGGTGATVGTTTQGGTTATSAGAGTGSTAGDGTYTGQSVGTRFGDVQVQVTIAGGVLTDVTALHLTDNDGRSVQISNRAAPILQREVLASQSADVANVSGATYTSDAYLSSLQSALDQAGF